LSTLVSDRPQPNRPASSARARGDLPQMSSKRVRLRTITDRDSAFLYELMTSPHAGGRVRFGGATPNPEKVAASLWDSVLAQFVIEGLRSEEALGLVAITSPNFRDAFAYISALGTSEAQGSGLIMEGVLLGFHYAFSTWPFRKIYMEATEGSLQAFKSGLNDFFVEEGRLREHVFWNGRYLDLVILAVYRDLWVQRAPVYLRRLCGVTPTETDAAPADAPALIPEPQS
jgi:RimJ/RimL family protein N-acetyltransferase